MKSFLIALSIVFLFFYCGIFLFGHFFVGGYITKETEQKYIRNLSKYKWDEPIMYRSYIHDDSLACFAFMPLQFIDPFHKWYIMDNVGAVRPGSELSKKLDSIYYRTKNKLK